MRQVVLQYAQIFLDITILFIINYGDNKSIIIFLLGIIDIEDVIVFSQNVQMEKRKMNDIVYIIL